MLPPQANTALPAPAPHGYQWGTNAETIDSDALSPDLTGVNTSASRP
ncbi:TPA: hypothetical protein ACT5CR_000192 [Burkholderia cenocepacia]|nr:hypothetical protein [Burkholderia cenocepacia]MCW5153336.1 hypothetical protein [Burkholderia cenocepacia]MCW5157246.1 hypothetical protein [Burkholderia cenocepacia]MCW5165122.1 hypothetical protein [Burkholderia cenocepacia]MDR5646665.1 hypothetical protein [Burkholderia cenocepacia]